MGRVEILADHFLELSEGDGIDVQLPLEVLAHLLLHLVDSPETRTLPKAGGCGVGKCLKDMPKLT